jgi:hypothetical protein
MVAGRLRVWQVKLRRLDGLQRQVDAGYLVIGASERPEDEEVALGLG